MARGLHYASLTDCAWTSDGRTLIIASRDGYISFISFDETELGEVYTPPAPVDVAVKKVDESVDSVPIGAIAASTTLITPNEGKSAVSKPILSSPVLAPADLSCKFQPALYS